MRSLGDVEELEAFVEGNLWITFFQQYRTNLPQPQVFTFSQMPIITIPHFLPKQRQGSYSFSSIMFFTMAARKTK